MRMTTQATPVAALLCYTLATALLLLGPGAAQGESPLGSLADFWTLRSDPEAEDAPPDREGRGASHGASTAGDVIDSAEEARPGTEGAAEAAGPTDGPNAALAWQPPPRPFTPYLNRNAEGLVGYLLTKRRELLERNYRRAGRFLPMIRHTLGRSGVPPEMAMVAAIESGFNPRARSYANAVGLWQFTAPTARAFGLRVELPWYDERLDPVAATEAAARLLGYLHDRYGNWEVALAAYNAGESRVNRAIALARQRGTPQDYWSLPLPRETRGYVPEFLAIVELYGNPERHGLSPEQEPALAAEPVWLTLPISLRGLAARLGVEQQSLVQLNYAWVAGMIPRSQGAPYRLWLPPGSSAELAASLEDRPPSPEPWLEHKVRGGETISHIARAYGVRIPDVLALNGLGSRELIFPGQALLIPLPRQEVESKAEQARPLERHVAANADASS